MSKLEVVADASALVAELLRRRGRQLLTHPDLSLYLTEPQWEETQRHLTQRVQAVARRHGRPPEAAAELLTEALGLAEDTLELVPLESYAELEPLARRRIPRDPSDWPTVGLALALGADIWTLDPDFFGCGVATWTTEVLLAELQS